MVCDISVAISNLGNSEKMFTKHFNNFKEKYESLDKKILNLIEAGEYDECARLCHSVKGISGMLALNDLYADVIKLEDFLKAREPEDKIMYSYLRVKNDIEAIIEYDVEKYRNK